MLNDEELFFSLNPSRYWLPHIEFNEFHISFHNLGQIFGELRSHAREQFGVSHTIFPLFCTLSNSNISQNTKIPKERV